MGIEVAAEYGIDTIVSGLSRGQIIEMRLEGLMDAGVMTEEEIDNNLLMFREVFHSKENIFFDILGGQAPKEFLSNLHFIDFFRYDDTDTKGIREYLLANGWVEPKDTGFCSTNCRVNDVGTFIHLKKKGYHFYEAPLSWDSRLGVITRKKAEDELAPRFNTKSIDQILTKLGYFDPVKIEDAVVVVKKDNSGEAYLCAYYVSDRTIDKKLLIDFLKKSLPDYMIPSFFMQLKELPLTVNGKLDAVSLPDPRVEAGKDFKSPANETESKLRELWAEVLELDKKAISTNRSFFELGGQSLKATLLMNKINRQFEVDLPLKEIFDKRTIEGIADYLITMKQMAGEFEDQGLVEISI
jgi:acyl carrier protein